jgi:hypothetical protein
MNDPHDNAADDAERMKQITTDMAIAAFRETERVALLADQKQFALAKLLKGRLNMDRYFRETETIRAEFEQRRARAAQRGQLPRPIPVSPEWKR